MLSNNTKKTLVFIFGGLSSAFLWLLMETFFYTAGELPRPGQASFDKSPPIGMMKLQIIVSTASAVVFPDQTKAEIDWKAGFSEQFSFENSKHLGTLVLIWL